MHRLITKACCLHWARADRCLAPIRANAVERERLFANDWPPAGTMGQPQSGVLQPDHPGRRQWCEGLHQRRRRRWPRCFGQSGTDPSPQPCAVGHGFLRRGAGEGPGQALNASALNRYALQGAGLQLQGRYFQLHYTLTWAKGLGDYAGWVPSNIESQPGNSRVNLSVSYLF